MKPLSETQKVVMRLKAEGLRNDEVAEKLGKSIHVVKIHLSKVIKKLEARNTTHALYIALKNNLLEL